MNRRTFLQSVLGAAAAADVRASQAQRRILILSVDGLDPEYLRLSDLPNVRRMMQSGAYAEGEGVIPSVTNVNNASIVTAAFPEEHGITGNYYYDRAAGKEQYMESAEFLLRPTIFESARTRGLRSAMITVKHKLLTLLSRGTEVALSAEQPPREFVDSIGAPPSIYSAEVNYWALRTARHLLAEGRFNLLYVATTDYMMHTFPPEDERSREHLHNVDRILGEILHEHPDLETCVTADHGMTLKTEAVDLGRVLASKGIRAEAVPIIKDQHVVHHGNLGGACYIYLENPAERRNASEVLRGVEGVEELYDTDQAATLFHLHPGRIGDLFILGAKHVAFGGLDRVREDVHVRSHGSRYEAAVPILCFGGTSRGNQYRMNLDVTRNLRVIA